MIYCRTLHDDLFRGVAYKGRRLGSSCAQMLCQTQQLTMQERRVEGMWSSSMLCTDIPVLQLEHCCPHAGKVHKRNTLEQLKLVGPNTLSVALLTAAFVGMVFTIQAR